MVRRRISRTTGRALRALTRGAVLLVTAWSTSTGSADAGTPTGELRRIFAEANRVLAEPTAEAAPVERLNAMLEIAGRAFAFEDAAQRALGPDWGARTASERAEFVALFTELLQRAFVLGLAARVRPADGLELRVHREAIAGDTATVHTTVATRHRDSVAVDYRMVRSGGRWMIGDVALEGISLVANYRAQVSRVLREASYDDLMTRMKAKSFTASAGMARARTPEGSTAIEPASTARPAVPFLLDAAVIESRHPGPGGDGGVPGLVPEARPAPASGVATALRPSRRGPDEGDGSAPLARRDPGSADGASPAVISAAVPPGLEAARARRAGDASGPSPRGSSRDAMPERLLEARGDAPVSVREVRTVAAVRAPPRAAVQAAAARASYWVQVGAFRNGASARQLAGTLRTQELPVRTELTDATAGADARLTRVRVGPFGERATAMAALERLRQRGLAPFLVVDREGVDAAAVR